MFDQKIDMIEGGKYGPEAQTVLDLTQANVVVLIVIGGDRGHGFTACGNRSRGEVDLFDLPGILAQLALRMQERLEI